MSSAFIDFDKLMEQYDFYNEFAVHDLRYLKKEYLPFVKAIPIEWIEKYKRVRGWEVTVTTQNAIDNMLNAWGKENERDQISEHKE